MCSILQSYQQKLKELKNETDEAGDDDDDVVKISEKMAALSVIKTIARAGLTAACEGVRTKYEVGKVLV